MAEKAPERVETAPDPEEDDLDDLDDVLDEFSAKPKTSSKPSTTASHPADVPAEHIPSFHDDEFAKQIQAGMQNLMGEMDANPQMQKEFEKMMQELMAAGEAPTDEEAMRHIGKATEAITHPAPDAGPKKEPIAQTKEEPKASGPAAASSSASTAGAKAGAQESFQDTIRRTMERMQASGEHASAAAAAGDSSEEDMIAQLMKEMGTSGGEGEEDFNKMLMGMMSQLTHKDILYEPMKELDDKFPSWMKEHKGKVGAEDMERYVNQQRLVGEIVARFEKSGYSDDSEEDREYITDKMQKMQAQGSPPPDLVGDMSAAQEALGELDGGCPTQ